MSDMLSLTPTAGSLGATVDGLNLDNIESYADALRDALDSHLVLFLPGLDPELTELRDLGRIFGELEDHPYNPKVDEAVPEVCGLDSADTPKADVWHTDATFLEEPPTMAMLHMADCPQFGGDTTWINTFGVYESLSEPMKAFLKPLTCIHRDAGQGQRKAEHPLIRVHPVSGRKALFVNKQFARQIPQLARPESQMLLQHLFRWQEQVKFSCRWRWSPGDVVLWDERFTLHSVVDDTTDRRQLRRVMAMGTAPIGPDAEVWPHHTRDEMASSGYFGIGGYEF
jgi:taurine dioxygenase